MSCGRGGKALRRIGRVEVGSLEMIMARGSFQTYDALAVHMNKDQLLRKIILVPRLYSRQYLNEETMTDNIPLGDDDLPDYHHQWLG